MAAENGDFITLPVKVPRQNAADLPAAPGKHYPQRLRCNHAANSIMEPVLKDKRAIHPAKKNGPGSSPRPFKNKVPLN